MGRDSVRLIAGRKSDDVIASSLFARDVEAEDGDLEASSFSLAGCSACFGTGSLCACCPKRKRLRPRTVSWAEPWHLLLIENPAGVANC